MYEYIILRIYCHFTRSTLSKRETTQRKTTQMIILVTSIFGFCNILPFALNIWEAFDYDAFWSQNPSQLALVVVDLSNILVIFHSSTTFLVYLAYCSKYRRICLYFLSLRKFDTSFRSTYSFISNYRANTTKNFCNYNYNEILLSKMSSFRTVYRAGSSPCSTPSLPRTPKVCWSRNENIRVKVVKSNFIIAASDNTRQGSILRKVERKRSFSL
uniref:G-protein coupled receptors family 1 profile domain-containing protein n=1 Tax=Romanomermis culicivorax TaxID=13658 RepID=A0A915KS94_ROMCU